MVGPPPFWSRLGAVWLGLGVAAFLTAGIAGIYRSVVTRHWIPPVPVEYTSEIREALRRGGPGAALPQLRAAAAIDFDNEQVLSDLLAAARAADDVAAMTLALEALVRFRPQDAEKRQELTALLLDQGRVYEALQHGNVALRLTPDSPAAWCNVGAALLGLDEKREAAACYRKALELDPTSQAASMALAYPLRGY